MRVALVIDLLDNINVKKDSSLALACAAKELGCEVYLIEYNQLFFAGYGVHANAHRIEAIDSQVQEIIHDGELWDYLTFSDPLVLAAEDLDIVMMRKDPPMDQAYWATTYLLQLWEVAGVLVANSTRMLRNFNEKCSILCFPELITDTVVTAELAIMDAFLEKQGTIILKPLDGMGGAGIEKLTAGDPAAQKTFMTATEQQRVPVMLQKVLDIDAAGDKRILLFHGIPLPYALQRMPAAGEFRANLALGGSGHVVELTKADKKLADLVARRLPIDELSFVGLDVIDGHLSEINITSPTCLREIQQHVGVDYARDYVKTLVSKV
jgi:glutathione synthase